MFVSKYFFFIEDFLRFQSVRFYVHPKATYRYCEIIQFIWTLLVVYSQYINVNALLNCLHCHVQLFWESRLFKDNTFVNLSIPEKGTLISLFNLLRFFVLSLCLNWILKNIFLPFLFNCWKILTQVKTSKHTENYCFCLVWGPNEKISN